MASAIKRLGTEQRNLQKEEKRVCDIYAEPLEDNIFEWHFTVLGAPESESFREGIYHGVLLFSRQYPFSPPDILFLTPNGRFELKTKICSSISSFHPEAWRPSYDVPFILQALRLFMAQEDENGVGTIHKTNVSEKEKKRLAAESWTFECPICQAKMKQLWEERLCMYPATSGEVLASVPSRPAAAVAAAAEGGDKSNSTAPQPLQQDEEMTAAKETEDDKAESPVVRHTEGKQDAATSSPSPAPAAAEGGEGESTPTRQKAESAAEEKNVVAALPLQAENIVTTSATVTTDGPAPAAPATTTTTTTTTTPAPPPPPAEEQHEEQQPQELAPQGEQRNGIVVEIGGFHIHMSVKLVDRLILFFLSVSALILLRRFVVYIVF